MFAMKLVFQYQQELVSTYSQHVHVPSAHFAKGLQPVTPRINVYMTKPMFTNLCIGEALMLNTAADNAMKKANGDANNNLEEKKVPHRQDERYTDDHILHSNDKLPSRTQLDATEVFDEEGFVPRSTAFGKNDKEEPTPTGAASKQYDKKQPNKQDFSPKVTENLVRCLIRELIWVNVLVQYVPYHRCRGIGWVTLKKVPNTCLAVKLKACEIFNVKPCTVELIHGMTVSVLLESDSHSFPNHLHSTRSSKSSTTTES